MVWYLDDDSNQQGESGFGLRTGSGSGFSLDGPSTFGGGSGTRPAGAGSYAPGGHLPGNPGGPNGMDGFFMPAEFEPDRKKLAQDHPHQLLSDNELWGVQTGFVIPYWRHVKSNNWVSDDASDPMDWDYMHANGFKPMSGIVGMPNIRRYLGFHGPEKDADWHAFVNESAGESVGAQPVAPTAGDGGLSGVEATPVVGGREDAASQAFSLCMEGCEGLVGDALVACQQACKRNHGDPQREQAPEWRGTPPQQLPRPSSQSEWDRKWCEGGCMRAWPSGPKQEECLKDCARKYR